MFFDLPQQVQFEDHRNNNDDDETGGIRIVSTMLNRAESIAYPKTGTFAKINFLIRQNSRAVVATMAFLVFVVVLSLDTVQKNSTGAGVTSSLRNM